LQDDSVACIRALIAYSAYQLAVLPKVTPFAPRSGQIGLDMYLAACQDVIDKYTQAASDLSDRYTKFGQALSLCQDNLQNAINKSATVRHHICSFMHVKMLTYACKKDAKSARDSLQGEKDKYKSQTIMGVLEIFGAVALFAIGAFLPGVGLLAIGAGAYLLYKGIKDLKGLAEIRCPQTTRSR
jgi:hypothetical protein